MRATWILFTVLLLLRSTTGEDGRYCAARRSVRAVVVASSGCSCAVVVLLLCCCCAAAVRGAGVGALAEKRDKTKRRATLKKQTAVDLEKKKGVVCTYLVSR